MRKTNKIMIENLLINAGIEPTGTIDGDLELACSILPEIEKESPNSFKNYCESKSGLTID